MFVSGDMIRFPLCFIDIQIYLFIFLSKIQVSETNSTNSYIQIAMEQHS